MADRLTAAQLASFSKQVMTGKVTKTCFFENDTVSSTDITARVKVWSTSKFELYNKHPINSGGLRFPFVDLMVDNSDGYFDRGGTAFPNGSSDIESTLVTVTVKIGTTTFLDFDGVAREPEYTDDGIIHLIADHPLVALAERRWVREDRVGGDTGLNISTVS